MTDTRTSYWWAQTLAVTLVAIALIVVGIWWWLVRRPLAKLDGRIALTGLKAGVVVDRDVWGVPWIRASSANDMIEAQGYVTAADRLWQMDLLRRAAAGRLAEIFGPGALEQDKERRTLGLEQAAMAAARSLDPQERAMVDAYARGVNQYIENHRWNLPLEFRLLRYRPKPWTAADTFLVSGYMNELLSSTWREDLDRARVTARVGIDRARDLYGRTVDSSYDHVLAGTGSAAALFVNPDVASAPAGDSPPVAAPPFATAAKADTATAAEWRRGQMLLGELPEQIRALFGSNNFVVSGEHTYSGKPLLANDTHLPLGVPCIWYINHLSSPGWNVDGFSLPGVPLVIVGHNDRIAWGFTNNMADVQDVYIETLNPHNPRQYRVDGRWASAETRVETIHVRRGPDVHLEVDQTRHGPIVYRRGNFGYALQWTALQPGGLGFGFPLIGRARNWQQFLDVIRLIAGPVQNAVYADVDGNIGFVVAGRVPIRKKGNGTVPVPGDTDEYGWAGYIPFDQLPQVFNPPDGIIATANARIVGPNYKYWFTDRWGEPYRTARIYDLLQGRKNLRAADMDEVQADVVSLPDRFLARQILDASRMHPPTDADARDLVSHLNGWDGRAVADTVETSFLTYVRRALLEDLLKPYLGNETSMYRWPRDVVFVENVLRERPARWLPPAYSSYDLLLVAAADQAVARLRATWGPREDDWRWGRVNSLELQHPLALRGPLHWLLDVGPIGHDGSAYTVNATHGGYGPAMRFVSDMANYDDSLMELTPGESGQYGSPYYRNEFTAWVSGHGVPAPFSPEAEAKARAHELILESAPSIAASLRAPPTALHRVVR